MFIFPSYISSNLIIRNQKKLSIERRRKIKTFIAGLAVTSLLVLGAMAYAHGPGAGGWGGGNMMGQGYGGRMMGEGY